MTTEKSPDAVRDMVREGYAKIASRAPSCCPADTRNADAIARRIGYSEEELRTVPEGANLGVGCGTPLALADVRPGETVLDLGSGAGFDALLAAKAVGPAGRVIGVDMTPEMNARAAANARVAGATHVEFREGTIESLPLADASVDVVISNCVINLSGDKGAVLRESARVLRPGGRFAVSDVVADPDMDETTRADMRQWTGCIAGALTRDEFEHELRVAGFADVEIVETHRVHDSAGSAIVRATLPSG
jgi:arsenite methyltransferase